MNWMDQFECHKDKLWHTFNSFNQTIFFESKKKTEKKSQDVFSHCNLVFILEAEVD